jgi:putative glutamine amidotransferase
MDPMPAAADARPLIGLPGRRKQIRELSGFPPALGHLDVDVYFADYARNVLAAGGLPVHLPIDADPAHWLDALDGIVLTGGADVEPERYGHPNHASSTEPRRDDIEFALLDGAVSRRLPVIGICRGLQVVNVFAGGTLAQDVPAHAQHDLGPRAESHVVTIEPASELHAIYGAQASVNSLHHQAIDTLGSGVRATATAEDGTIEGIELDGAPVIAVQWHPEMLRGDDPLFEWVVERARRRRHG